MTIRLRRVYDPAPRGEGRRVLVERLWPRGMRKEALRLDAWLKEIAPSPALRRWYGHQLARWPEFERRYRAELAAHPDGLEPLLEAARAGPLTLLYSARDTAHNSALVLKEVLEELLSAGPRSRKKAATRPAPLR
jgi:uncharacterized protein YeaO (DUF488 family)